MQKLRLVSQPEDNIRVQHFVGITQFIESLRSPSFQKLQKCLQTIIIGPPQQVTVVVSKALVFPDGFDDAVRILVLFHPEYVGGFIPQEI